MYRLALILVSICIHCAAFTSIRPVPWTSRLQHRSPLRMSAAPVAEAQDISGDGGVRRKVLRKGNGRTLTPGDIALVSYKGKVKETGLIFAQGDTYRCTLEDGTMISGWDIGLGGLSVGDKAVIECTSRYGYGSDGVGQVVPPNSSLEFEVEVIEHEGNIMNPSSFVDANPLTPRTPENIKLVFDKKRQDQADASGPEETGLQAGLKRFKSMYIFGLFESLDGQEAPWYLRPIITFPIMFAVCGFAFYAVVFLNGITTERNFSTQDDPELAFNTFTYVMDQLKA